MHIRRGWIVLVLITLIACNSQPAKQTQVSRPDSIQAQLNQLAADSIAVQKKDDSLEALYERGDIIFGSVIRLHEHNDQLYVYNDKDTSDIVLKRDSCTAYSRYARKMIPAEDVKAYDLVWSVAEVRQEVGNEGGGGYHQVFLVMEQRPEDEGSEGYYRVSVKRMYEQRWGRVFPVGFVRVRLHPRRIMIENTMDGSVLDLAAWRRLPDSLRD